MAFSYQPSLTLSEVSQRYRTFLQNYYGVKWIPPYTGSLHVIECIRLEQKIVALAIK